MYVHMLVTPVGTTNVPLAVNTAAFLFKNCVRSISACSAVLTLDTVNASPSEGIVIAGAREMSTAVPLEAVPLAVLPFKVNVVSPVTVTVQFPSHTLVPLIATVSFVWNPCDDAVVTRNGAGLVPPTAEIVCELEFETFVGTPL